MPRKWHIVLVAFVLGAILVGGTAVAACPYCPRFDFTLSTKLADADEACIVAFIDSKDGEELSRQSTRFQIKQFLKPSKKYKVGDEVEIPIGVTGNKGDTFLLMGQKDDERFEWGLPVEIDEISREYVRQAPSPEVKPEEDRLVYFLKFLDVANPQISNDAFAEFSRAKFEDVERLVTKIDRDKLRTRVRKWLDDPNPQLVVRRAFYGMLLGLIGNDDDAEFLKNQIMAPIDPDKVRWGIEGMMGGFLILRGEDGLKFLVEKKINSIPKGWKLTDAQRDDLDAVRMTLSFLWDFRHHQFSEESLRSVLRRYLDGPQFAESVIVDLARWKDWSSLDRLIASYGQPPWETRSGKEKVVAFALACQKDPAAATKKKGEISSAEKATKFLDGLDPAFVQSVKSGGGLSPISIRPSNPKKD